MLEYDPFATYTLEDLSNWNFPGVSLAVLGYPVRHSISPQMHNASISEISSHEEKFKDWRYFRFEIKPEDLIAALPIFFEKGFFGLNLTVPHKTIAFDFIEDIERNAQPIGAINTLKRVGNSYRGYNTDGFGMQEGIKRELDRDLNGSEIFLLGAGGASRAAAVQSLQSGCKSLTIVNRNQDRLTELLNGISSIQGKNQILKGIAPSDPGLTIPTGSLVINATSLGLKENDPLPIPSTAISDPVDLYDMIYNPAETQLMNHVKSQGGRAANGLTMLIYQGVKALEHWTETTILPETMLNAAKKAMTP
ncbi:shikimate dehydrogenase [Puniceicoccaceae bacterium K14]|nr:shikimate dehydrogenase [Puniceicoccaceae bacterium K14]